MKEKKNHQVQQTHQTTYDPEIEVFGDWKLVDLPQITAVTGQQTESTILQLKVKLYRWRNQWKQRGIGTIKFLKDVQNGRIRLLMREEKTLKVRANHLLFSIGILCSLKKLTTNKNCWTWLSYDFSDEPQGKTQKFCVKLRTQEQSNKFKEEFEKSCEINKQILQ